MRAPREGKRKVGRPLSYSGDPNSPSLTSEERRKLRRRACNRESANRVRARKSAKMEELGSRISELEEVQRAALDSADAIARQRDALEAAVGRAHASLAACAADNERLREEIRRLVQLEEEHVQQQRMLCRQPQGLDGALRFGSVDPSSGAASAADSSRENENICLLSNGWTDEETKGRAPTSSQLPQMTHHQPPQTMSHQMTHHQPQSWPPLDLPTRHAADITFAPEAELFSFAGITTDEGSALFGGLPDFPAFLSVDMPRAGP